MMTIFNTIQKYDPYFVGFKNLFERMAEFDTNQPSTNYPPYNIIQDGEKYIIELAVAGFTENDISITHEPEHGRLVVEGSNENKDATYLHKGIGGRKFKRIFPITLGNLSMKLKINIQTVSVNLKEEILKEINNVQIEHPNPCP